MPSYTYLARVDNVVLYIQCVCSFIKTLHFKKNVHVPALGLVYEWFDTVDGRRPAVVLIQPFACVGPDRSV